MVEVWLPVVGYEGLYEVSNYGKVRSVNREVVGKSSSTKSIRGKILKPDCNKNGYEQCQLSKDGVVKNKKIHRLVAETFLPNPNNYPCVNHKDENKLNNKVENLEWCTYEYNTNYGTGVERQVLNNPQCKRIKVDDVLFHSIGEAARSLNCRPSTLSDALIRNRTTYKNHKIELI